MAVTVGDYIFRRNPNHFGFDVVKKNGSEKVVDWETIFRTSSTPQYNELFKRAKENPDNTLDLTGIVPEENYPPRILKWRTKYRDNHYLVHNEEELYSKALVIVKECESLNFYADLKPGAYEAEKAELALLSEEYIAKLPLALQKAAFRRMGELCEIVSPEPQIKTQAEYLKKALKAKNGQAAWRLLRLRQDHEYEKVELIDFSD